jgi:hypothetical protein
VTDYTSKSGTSVEHSSDWCPASLADRVLRIEMWRDAAVVLAQQMNPGEYWLLYNVRMKVSGNGYIEGSFSEAAKAKKLSTADVDSNQHFRALLQFVFFTKPWPHFFQADSLRLTGGRKHGKRRTRLPMCFHISCSVKHRFSLFLTVPSRWAPLFAV